MSKWQKCELKDLIIGDIRNGYSPVCMSVDSSHGWVLSLGALTPRGLDYTQRKPAPKDKQLIRAKLNDNDILISRSNTPERVGMSSIFHEQKESYYFPDLMMRFRVKESQILPVYLWHRLNTTDALKHLRSHAAGSSISMVKITGDIVKKYSFFLPPLNEQRRIADVLGTWDEAIGKTEQLLEKERISLAAYMQKLFSNYANVPIIPLGKLTNCVTLEKGKTLDSKTVIEGDIPVVAGGKTIPYYNNQYTHNEDTVTISASGAYAGYIWFHTGKIWASDCNVITSKTMNVKFLYYALKLQQDEIYNLQTGGAQPHVYTKDIAKIKIPFIERCQQDYLVEILDIFEKKIILLQKELAALQKQKRGLMQKLLTGTWRV